MKFIKMHSCVFFLLLSITLHAQSNYSLTVRPPGAAGVLASPPEYAYDLVASGFTFDPNVPASAFQCSGKYPMQVQSVYYISSTELVLFVQSACVGPQDLITISYANDSVSPAVRVYGSITNQSTVYDIMFSNRSYYCEDQFNGVASFKIRSGGTAPYTVVYDNIISKDTIKGVQQNQLVDLKNVGALANLTVIDQAGCVNQEIKIDEYGAIIINVQGEGTTVSDSTCNGTASYTIFGNVGGKLQYQWYGKDSVPLPGKIQDSISGLCPGTYYLIARIPAFDNSPSCSTIVKAVIPSKTIAGLDEEINRTSIFSYVSNDHLIVENAPDYAVLSIFDLRGVSKLQKQLSLPSGDSRVDIGILSSGLYIYKIEYSGKIVLGKFLK